ncbi:putative protein ABIL2 isoform X2 [Typha angustifolia]|uniref:putative protein ABIL2 isoform X2 n=1 Tax=Typha angustifolia TaxID=59011 RepID=UPI003C2F3190
MGSGCCFSSFPLLSSSFPSMDVMSPSLSSSFEELSMQQTLHFSDRLKDLRTLRSQLYSAAEYFELSYTKDDQKQIVVDSLKDYTVKALVNTVDHLGSVSFKVNGLLDNKFDEVSESEIRVCCIDQRVRTCQQYMDREGLSQQSLVITAPKYHKRYALPNRCMSESGRYAVPNYQELEKHQNNSVPHQFHAEVQEKAKEKLFSFRKMRSMPHGHGPSQRARSSSPAQRVRSSSPFLRPGKHLGEDIRSGSSISHSGPLTRKTSLINSTSGKLRYFSGPQKSAALMNIHAERKDDREIEENLSKSKRLLKSLLSRRKSRKDGTMYNYLDEY